MTPILIPLAHIDADALPRDRSTLDPTPLAELRDSILATGLRIPVEVFERDDPDIPYGLLSGSRRLACFRELAGHWGLPAFAEIPAIVRTLTSITDALARMVEENDLRADISPWDKARIVVETVQNDWFPTLDAAVTGLYPAADRFRRARIRAAAEVVEAFDGLFPDPTHLSQRQIMRLSTAHRAGFDDLVRAAVREAGARAKLPHVMEEVETVLLEAEALTRTPDPCTYRPGRPRRLVRIREKLLIRCEQLANGWALRFTGEAATGSLMEEIMDDVEKWYEKW